jgi:hypothetical protein
MRKAPYLLSATPSTDVRLSWSTFVDEEALQSEREWTTADTLLTTDTEAI